MLLVLLAWMACAAAPTLELFPEGPMLEIAWAEPDASPAPPPDGPASEAPADRVARLPERQQISIRRLLRARRTRDVSFLIGMGSGFAAAAGLGALRRGATCDTCGRGWRVAGTGLLIGSVVGVEVGAVTGLIAVARERRELVRLGAGITPTNGIITGWSLMAAQIFLPGLGAGFAYAGIGGQALINDRVTRRLRR